MRLVGVLGDITPSIKADVKHWQYNGPKKRYIYTLTPAGKRHFGVNSRNVTRTRIQKLRDELARRFVNQVGGLAEEITKTDNYPETLRKLREPLKNLYIAQYALAKGGVSRLDQRDYGRIGAMLVKQYRRIDDWADDLVNGSTPNTINQNLNRFGLYGLSSVQAFERGYAASFGLPRSPEFNNRELPVYPGEGQTVCKSRCDCSWQITEVEDSWECVWMLGNRIKHCADCLELANVRYSSSNPLIILKVEEPLNTIEEIEGGDDNGAS